MHLLSNSDLSQVSGGLTVSQDEMGQSMRDYSFSFALIGGGASLAYGLCTNHLVTTVVGSTARTASSFPDVFWVGLGVSWAVGTIVGIGMAAYNAHLAESN